MAFGLLEMEWLRDSRILFFGTTLSESGHSCVMDVWVDVALDVTSSTIQFSLDVEFSHWWERGRQVRHPLSS